MYGLDIIRTCMFSNEEFKFDLHSNIIYMEGTVEA